MLSLVGEIKKKKKITTGQVDPFHNLGHNPDSATLVRPVLKCLVACIKSD